VQSNTVKAGRLRPSQTPEQSVRKCHALTEDPWDSTCVQLEQVLSVDKEKNGLAFTLRSILVGKACIVLVLKSVPRRPASGCVLGRLILFCVVQKGERIPYCMRNDMSAFVMEQFIYSVFLPSVSFWQATRMQAPCISSHLGTRKMSSGRYVLNVLDGLM